MNRIQQKECLVQLPNKICHLPEGAPELVWFGLLDPNATRAFLCLSFFPKSVSGLRASNILHLTQGRTGPGNKLEMPLLFWKVIFAKMQMEMVLPRLKGMTVIFMKRSDL